MKKGMRRMIADIETEVAFTRRMIGRDHLDLLLGEEDPAAPVRPLLHRPHDGRRLALAASSSSIPGDIWVLDLESQREIARFDDVYNKLPLSGAVAEPSSPRAPSVSRSASG